MAAVGIQSMPGYRSALARAGFDGIEAEDLTREWIAVLRERLVAYRRARPGAVARLGAVRYDEYEQLSVFFLRLVERGRLGGARFSARSDPAAPWASWPRRA